MPTLTIKDIGFDNDSSYVLVNSTKYNNIENNTININTNPDNNNILFYLNNVQLESNPNILFDNLSANVSFDNATNLELKYTDFEGISLNSNINNVTSSTINKDIPFIVYGNNNKILNDSPLIIEPVIDSINDSTNNILINDNTASIPTQQLYTNIQNSLLTKAKNYFDYLTKKADVENISDFFKYFYKTFFDSTYDFDINGFSIIFMYPPHLSGDLEYDTPEILFKDRFQDFMIFAVEFDVNDIELKTSSIEISSGSEMQYVSGFTTSQDLSVRYIDDKTLKIYGFHSDWFNYIKDIIYGNKFPLDEYIDSKELDYMASFYYLKFKSNMDVPNYIGKASGIFPKSLPVKDLFGNRTDNQIIMYNINYFCASYEGFVLEFMQDANGNYITDSNGNYVPAKKNWLYDEFNEVITNTYKKIITVQDAIDSVPQNATQSIIPVDTPSKYASHSYITDNNAPAIDIKTYEKEIADITDSLINNKYPPYDSSFLLILSEKFPNVEKPVIAKIIAAVHNPEVIENVNVMLTLMYSTLYRINIQVSNICSPSFYPNIVYKEIVNGRSADTIAKIADSIIGSSLPNYNSNELYRKILISAVAYQIQTRICVK
ncbi:MAG: hypothetical protein IPH62_19490 [Ignavibacteriae bacterium]|nr:hypothetical protein [Ignavibacteriota bacterium]